MTTTPKKKDISEKDVKKRVMDIIKLFSKYADFYTLCPMTFGYGASGHPDILVLVRGKLIGIEVKKDANNHHTRPELKAKPNEVAQKIQKEKIKAAGGKWYCVHRGNILSIVIELITYSGVGFGNMDTEDEAKLHKLREPM